MSARDELANAMARHRIDPDFICTCGADFFPEERVEELDRDNDAFVAAFEAHQADTLAAAGWVKPRTITTVEELNALPATAVVLDPAGITWQKRDAGNDPLWHAAKHGTLRRDGEALFERSPFTVLHEGQA